jgi:hypothetical protein
MCLLISYHVVVLMLDILILYSLDTCFRVIGVTTVIYLQHEERNVQAQGSGRLSCGGGLHAKAVRDGG